MTEEQKKKKGERNEGLDNLVDKQKIPPKPKLAPSVSDAEMKAIMDNIRKKAAEKKLRQQQQLKSDIQLYDIRPDYLKIQSPAREDGSPDAIPPDARAEVERIVKAFNQTGEKSESETINKDFPEKRKEGLNEIPEELPDFSEEAESGFVEWIRKIKEQRESKAKPGSPFLPKAFTKRNVSIILILLIVVLFSAFAFIRFPDMGITGKATGIYLDEYRTLELNKYFSSNSGLAFKVPEARALRSLELSGDFMGDGSFRIYLESGGNRYLVADSANIKKRFPPATGVELQDIGYEEKLDTDTNADDIQIVIGYGDDPQWDPENDGAEHARNAIDFTVRDSAVPENTSLLCTRWTINNIAEQSRCFGNEECCSFLGLVATGEEWDAPFHVHARMKGVGKENSIKARIVNFNFEDVDITYSQEAALPARFYSELYEFDGYCEETCNLTDEIGDYRIILETTDDIFLNLGTASYSLGMEKIEKIEDFPEIVLLDRYDWGGDYKLVDNYDQTFDLEIFTSPAKHFTGKLDKALKGADVRMKSIPKAQTGSITARFGLSDEPGISTAVFALEEGVESDEMTFILGKIGPVDYVMACPDFDMHGFTCAGDWERTNITFREDANRIRFIAEIGAQAYAGGAFEKFSFNPEIRDSSGSLVEYDIDIIDSSTGDLRLKEKIRKQEGFVESSGRRFNLDKGRYDIWIRPKNISIKEIRMNRLELDSDLARFIRIDDVEEAREYSMYNEIYAIDPTSVNFTNATVVATAKGRELIKCFEWNFSEQTCYGNWVKIMDIVPGQDYTFTLTPDDPALAEVSGNFFEDWETGTFDTNNWTVIDGSTSGWTVSTSEGPIGTYHAIARNTDSETTLRNNVSTAGYENITFSFWWATDTNLFDSPDDYYYADWYNGTEWIRVFSHTSGKENTYTFESYALPADADDNSDFKIRFICNVNLGTEGCDLDNITVSGDFIPINYFPNVTLVNPADNSNTTINEINFTCNATDETSLSNITFYWDYNGTWQANGTVAVGGASNQSVFQRSGLDDGSIEWNCQACDNTGQCNFSDSNWSVTVDATPPAISNVNATSIDNSSALIVWDTDENANSTVEYGTTLSLGNFSTDANLVTSHSIGLTDLKNGTLYYYNVTSCDAYGNCNTSGPYNFTTTQAADTSPPIITNVTATAFWYNATITWQTDEGSNSTVEYGTTLSLGNNSTDPSNVLNHSVDLSPLQDNTTYYYNVTSCDLNDNCNTSGPFNFTTLLDLPPNVTDISPSPGMNITRGDDVVIEANVTDDISVKTVYALVAKPNGTVSQLNLTLAAGLYCRLFMDTDQLGRYNVTINASDNYGNINDTETTYFFVVADATSPNITGISDYPDPVNRSQLLNITANVTDNIGVDTVLVEINGINYTMNRTYLMDQSIVFDGFESGTLGWTTSGPGDPWTVTTTDPSTGTYHAQAQKTGSGDPSYMTLALSTENFTNIVVNYDRKLVGLDTTDDFSAEYFNGTAWVTLEQLGGASANDANYVSQQYNLSADANDDPLFEIRFMCECGATSEYCRVDNVNITGDKLSDTWEYQFNNSALSPGYYSYTVFANDTNGNDAIPKTGTFLIVEELVPPNVTLNYPPDNFTTRIPSINFTWTATNGVDTNLTCNLTINGTVNVSDIASLNNTPTNLTVSGFSEGDYYWNVTCWDDSMNTNTSETRKFTIFVPFVAYTLTLPGEAPVQCNDTPPFPATPSMEFNSTNGSQTDVDPCVVGTGACQNSTTPFFLFTNIGNVNLTWIVNLNASLPSVFNMKANTAYNPSAATNITASLYNLSENIAVNANVSGFFFADFFSAVRDDSTSRQLQHNTTEYNSS